MTMALPRTRSFRRSRPMRLWWIATGLALLVNLAVVVVLSQISQLDHAVPEPPLAVRTLQRQPAEPPAPPPSLPREAALAASEAVAPALPSLDLPLAGPVSDLALPAATLSVLAFDLPWVIPAVAAPALPGGAGGAGLAVDTPAEREGAFDLERFYPRPAKLRGVTGSSRVRIAIAADGRVSAVTVLASEPAGVFDSAAERVARSLHYRPALREGQPVASEQETVIAWSLK